MHHRSLLEIAFAAIGISHEGAGPATIKPTHRDPGPTDYDEDWIGPISFSADDGQNGDGAA
jgi:hypothetical protein